MTYVGPVIHHLRIALVASKKSLAEAAAAADEVKARLGSSVGGTSKGLGSRARSGEVVDAGRSNSSGKDGDRSVKSKAEVSLVCMMCRKCTADCERGLLVDGGVSNLGGLFVAA